MYKRFLLPIVGLSLLTGCGSANDDASINNYYPIESNMLYSYQNSYGDDFSYTTYNTYVEENKVQHKVTTSSSDYIEVAEISNGELVLTYADPSAYYYENNLSAEPNLGYVLLEAPLEEGNTWEYKDGVTSEITDMDAQVSTPAGDFIAMEVTTDFGAGSIEKVYYAEGVGIVQILEEQPELQYTVQLQSYETEATDQATINFYMYDEVEGKTVVEPRTIPIQTNMDYTAMFEAEMKKHTGNQMPLLTENTTINEIKVDRENSTVYVDLSKEFVEERQLDVETELILLQNIANTVGNFYVVDYVNITIDGEDYKSENLDRQGELFEVKKI